MSNIYYIWPHDFRWKNNVLGQRLIMLDSVGTLHVLARRSKWLPMNLDFKINITLYGISSKVNEYISILTYIMSVLCFLTFKRLLGYISSSDVVYTNFEYSNIIGIWAKEILGMKWVADFFDDPRRGYFNAYLRSAPRWRVFLERTLLVLYRGFLHKADLIICNSPDSEIGLAPVLVKQFMVEKEKLLAVSGGVHDEYIKSCLEDPLLKQAARTLMKENGILGENYIYLVGHINSDVSGVHNVLKALRTLLREGIDYHLLLAGFCKRKEQVWLETVVQAMALSDRVHYAGVVDQRVSYLLMKEAGLCICPYNTEGRDDYLTAYPIKLLEYLTVGAPTITVQTPITEQIVNDFGSGELMPSSSEADLVHLIKALNSKDGSGSQGNVPVSYRWVNINKTLQKSLASRVLEAQ